MRASLILCLTLLACTTDPVAQDAALDAAVDTPTTVDVIESEMQARADAATDTASDLTADAPSDATADADDVVIVMGCPSLTAPVARPGDAPMGDTYAAFMQPFFTTWCVRCHSVRRVTAEERSGAPDGFNWDDEASVRTHLARIRNAVGVDNYMPLTDPKPSCAERRRVVRWVDLGAP